MRLFWHPVHTPADLLYSAQAIRVKYQDEPLEQVERLLLTLTPGEKARLVQTLVRDLGDAFAGIDSQPDVCGGDPCIVRTRIPVWVLEQARRQGMSEAELLQSYPALKAEDLTNAWAYVRAHHAEIEAQIAQNEAA